MRLPLAQHSPKLRAEELIGLKGRHSVGLMLAGIYDTAPEEGVETLVSFLRDFERRWG